MSPQASEPFDAARFRHVMGHYPTGVTIITACLDGRPGGMTVGSFTSVSLDPPLVGFFPEKSSTTFPHIREAGSFCVNILGAGQEPTCRAFARKGQDRFDGVGWRPAGSGSPILDDVIAWIDCDIESVTDAGDHYLVLGRVRALDVPGGHLPLMFFRGGFGKYEPLSLVAADEPDLVRLIRCSGLARPHLEELAAQIAAECTVSARVGSDLVVLASAGSARSQGGPPTVGRRFPMLPPLGSQFMAWEPDDQVDGWLARSPLPIGPGGRQAYREALARVREQGWLAYRADIGFDIVDRFARHTFGDTAGAADYAAFERVVAGLDPGFAAVDLAAVDGAPVSRVIAPVRGPDGRVVVAVNAHLDGAPCPVALLAEVRDRVLGCAARITAVLGADVPEAARP